MRTKTVIQGRIGSYKSGPGVSYHGQLVNVGKLREMVHNTCRRTILPKGQESKQAGIYIQSQVG